MLRPALAIDPMTIDFLEATKGHPVILNFSTIPQWMARTEKPVSYPSDPDQPVWDYAQGTEFRDPTFKEVADYYARLLSWYTQGGFTDELGKRHESGRRYTIPIWEVLNEPRTGTMINEIGAISADDLEQGTPGYVAKPFPASHWNLAGALYAYLVGELTRMGIDVAGESQLTRPRRPPCPPPGGSTARPSRWAGTPWPW